MKQTASGIPCKDAKLEQLKVVVKMNSNRVTLHNMMITMEHMAQQDPSLTLTHVLRLEALTIHDACPNMSGLVQLRYCMSNGQCSWCHLNGVDIGEQSPVSSSQLGECTLCHPLDMCLHWTPAISFRKRGLGGSNQGSQVEGSRCCFEVRYCSLVLGLIGLRLTKL